MNEETVRMQAAMYALVAEMYCEVAGIERMKADNEGRMMHGYALAWDGSCFKDASDALAGIAQALRTKI